MLASEKLKAKDIEIKKLNQKLLEYHKSSEKAKLMSFVQKLKTNNESTSKGKVELQILESEDRQSDNLSAKQNTASFHQSNNTSFERPM